MLNKIIEIVKQSSQFMRETNCTVSEKAGCENLVTSADIAVQNFLTEKLAQLLPNSAFICEEGDAARQAKEYTWIIDPIDGTANFTRELGQSAISVALQHGDTLLYGVVYNPFTDELYSAERGKGAFCNGKRLQVSNLPFRKALVFTAMSVYHKEYAKICADVNYELQMNCNDFRRFGTCALELCLLAAGKCELFFEICVQPWDYAAAQLVLEEAGGIATSAHGEKLTRTTPTGIVAANNAENHKKLLEIVQRHIAQSKLKI